MHRLNLSDQKISAKFPFLVIIIQLCKDLHGKYNWGIQHESLRLMAEVEEEKFIQLSKFSDTRFANSKRRVFQNVLKMFHSICASLDADILADLNNLESRFISVLNVREMASARHPITTRRSTLLPAPTATMGSECSTFILAGLV